MSKTVIFDLDFYKSSAIEQAISDYTDLAKIDINNDCHYYTCCLSGCTYDETLTAKEFSNYVLQLSLQNNEIS